MPMRVPLLGSSDPSWSLCVEELAAAYPGSQSDPYAIIEDVVLLPLISFVENLQLCANSIHM